MRVIHLARKPLSEGSVAANVLEHGTGALNIDATRISGEVPSVTGQGFKTEKYGGQIGRGDPTLTGVPWIPASNGRWPANLILQHLDGCRCTRTRRVKPVGALGRAGGGSGGSQTQYVGGEQQATVAAWECVPRCPVAALDEESGVSGSNWRADKGSGLGYHGGDGERGAAGHEDAGGASRFFKQVGGDDGPG